MVLSVWSDFKQQRLPAWQPILAPVNVAVALFALAVLMLPIAIAVSSANSHAKDITVRYDHINRCGPSNNQGAFSYTGNGLTLRTGCVTEVQFSLTETLQAPVYLYYGLTQFYQNHRRFSNSKSDAQLAGEPISSAGALSGCSPLAVPGDLRGTVATPITINGTRWTYGAGLYAPAGLVPWAMFNDTFALYRVAAGNDSTRILVCNSSAFSAFTNEPLPQGPHVGGKGCRKRGIAWDTDVAYKYKSVAFNSPLIWSAPRAVYGVTPLASSDDFYRNGWYANELGHAIPVSTDEDLMVWARPASLPHFRKLFRVITQDLPAGSYVMRVEEHFDVQGFGGSKSFTLATLSWMGGRNPFLCNLYWTICLVSAVSAGVFVLLHRRYRDRAEVVLGKLIMTETEYPH